MGRKGNGLEVRETSMRIAFVWNGRPYKETLMLEPGKPMPPTMPNQRQANRIADEIKTKIRLGVFDLKDYFPHSRNAEQEKARTFGELCEQWIDSCGQLTEATRDQYSTYVRFWKSMFGEDAPIEKLTHAHIKASIGKYEWRSAKQHNNYLIGLRGPMALEYHGKRSTENPTIGIGNLKTVKKQPDPLTPAERDAILAHMRQRYDVRVWAYFAFAFSTGMRPEEIIALRWSDWDRASSVIRVQRVRTFRGAERDGSKTHTVRDVELVPLAVEALEVMRPYTALKRIERPGDDDATCDIFERPAWAPGKGSTGGKPSEAGPWSDERSQRDQYWKPTLRALGIRARRAYCTRHTYCTVGLMAGVRPAYLAQQAGHSVKMLLETYAKWLPEADGGAERKRLAAAFAPSPPADPIAASG